MKSSDDSNKTIDDQIAIYRDMIEEIENNNHFEANPEVLLELEREYKNLIERKIQEF